MSVAIRLRHVLGRDPLDNHTLAMRLKGMGYEHLLPVPMAVLASNATLRFLLKDPALNRGVQRLVCVGPFDADVCTYLERNAERPVEFSDGAPEKSLKDALLFVSAKARGFDPDIADLRARNLQVVHEKDLCDRFDLIPA